MLYVCVSGVMDDVFYVCNVTRGDVGARVWEVSVFRHAYVVCLCLSSGSSQCCILHDLQFVNVKDAIGYHMEEAYSRSGLKLLV